MALWKQLWYYGQSYGTILRAMELPFTRKKHSRLPNLKDFDLKLKKKLWKNTKIIEVLNRLIALEL